MREQTSLRLHTAVRWGLVARAAVWTVLWAYVLLLAGSLSGLIAFPLQAASAVLMTGAVGVWLGSRLVQRRALPRTGLEWALIAVVATQLIATFFSQDVRRSLSPVAQSLAYLLLFYGAFDLARAGSPPNTKGGWSVDLGETLLLLIGAVVVGLALVGPDGLWPVYAEWRALAADLPYAPGFQHRSFAVLGDPNLLAGTLNVLIPLVLARAVATPRRLPRVALGGLAGAALLVHAFTGSRGGAVALAAALGVLVGLWFTVVSPSMRERAWSTVRARPWLVRGLALLVLILAAIIAWRMVSFRGYAMQAPLIEARATFWEAALRAFIDSPLWGVGPGTYPTSYMRVVSVPPERLFLHAHSLLFVTLAECGLLGIGALAWLAAGAGRALWRARLGRSYEARTRWAAVVAAAAGFAVHAQFDDFSRLLAVPVPLIVLVGSVLGESSESGEARTFSPLWLVAPGLMVAAFSVYTLRAHALSEQAVDAGVAGDWPRAARLFEQAASSDPSFAFYAEQAGYAYGRLAADADRSALEAGIRHLERATALEPAYALHHANLAALYWQAGRPAEALAAMRRAVALAPGAAMFQLNLGAYEEALQHTEAARLAYDAALTLNPAQAGSSYWTLTPLRQSVLANWKAHSDVTPNVLEQTRALLAAGDDAAAEQLLLAEWGRDTQQTLVYVAWAELARARGDEALAERYLRAAFWVQTPDVGAQLQAVLSAAELARAQGRTDVAIRNYQTVLEGVTDYGSLGWWTAGWTPHANFAFQRRALPVDVLPQVIRADFSHTLGLRLLPLGELYAAKGEAAHAQQVYATLLQHDPALREVIAP